MADFNHFPEMAAALPGIFRQIVKKAAFDIQALAMSRCAVDTGFLKSSIYTITPDARFTAGAKSTYGQGLTGSGPLLDSLPIPTGDEAWVGVGAAYGIWVEMGSKHGPAQPFMAPAAEAVLPQFQQAAQALEDHFKQVH